MKLANRRALVSGALLSAATLGPPLVTRALPPPSSRFDAPGRIVAVGDLHGDCRAFEDTLGLTGLYSTKDARWTGGNAVLVTIGDVLDRGNEERQIFELLRRLRSQAAAAGGRVVSLLGNHEVLNACGITSFVAPDADEFGPDRISAFRPGSDLAIEMSQWPVACVVGDTAFCHAGLTPAHARAGLDAINSVGAVAACACSFWLAPLVFCVPLLLLATC